MEVISDFHYHFKPFNTLNFAVTQCCFHLTCFVKVFLLLLFSLSKIKFLPWKLFYNINHVRYYNFSVAKVILESVNLMPMSKQKIISLWWRTIRFSWKRAHQNTEQKEGVLTKTRNNLKSAETTWNHQKTTWNHLKPALL